MMKFTNVSDWTRKIYPIIQHDINEIIGHGISRDHNVSWDTYLNVVAEIRIIRRQVKKFETATGKKKQMLQSQINIHLIKLDECLIYFKLVH